MVKSVLGSLGQWMMLAFWILVTVVEVSFSGAHPPTGCPFQTRCPRKIGEICETTEPELIEEEPGHGIRCHIPLEELRRLQQADDGQAPAADRAATG